MKSCLRWMAILVACVCSQAAAQDQFTQPFQPGETVVQQGPVRGELVRSGPGRLWFEANLADRGLGYDGSYFTVGGKSRLWDDFLDGRWLVEGQGHISAESGGFFGNIGIERVYSIHAAGADVIIGGWFDYDSDLQGLFAHTFQQVAVNAAVKTRTCDIIGNGYFPIGTTDYTQGDPTGQNCFYRNFIVLESGLDSALRGFDAMVIRRPDALGLVNGTIELGGYAYGSDLVADFGGVRIGAGMQLLDGLVIHGELNHDNRFDITGVVQLAWRTGSSNNPRGSEYAGLGRDLEPTIRNDHIVRYQRDLVTAIDPDTGLPYFVHHVDNTADPMGADGTFERPFAALADAEAASADDDVIFVYEGDGTDTNYDAGIVLKEGQLLLGDGVEHVIPIQNGQLFTLCNDQDGNRPRISNNGGDIVTIAGRNVVRGFIMEGNFMATNGIVGDASPVGPPIFHGVFEDNLITNVVGSGILLNTIGGDWSFARNTITGAGLDGVTILNGLDPDSVYNFEENVFSSNAREGLHMQTVDGDSFTFLLNTANANGRDGFSLEDYLNGDGVGAEVFFAGHTGNGNGRDGIFLFTVDGNVRVVNSTLNGNQAVGLDLINVTNTVAGHTTFVGTTLGGTNSFNGNDIGIVVNLNAPFGTQDVTITDGTFNGNATMGMYATASGLGTTLTTRFLDNISVSGNGGTGLRFTAVQGATHNMTVENTTAPLTMTGNGVIAGNGIDIFVGDDSPGLPASLVGTIRNVNLTGTTGIGMQIIVDQDGNINLLTEDVNINTSGSNGINAIVDTTATGLVNRLLFENVNVVGVGGTGQNSGADGVRLTVLDDSWVDFSFINGVIQDDAAAFTPLPQPEPLYHGFEAVVAGNANTLARIFFQNNVISNITPGSLGFVNDGLQLTLSGDSRTLATIDGNQILNNGPGTDPANLPYFDGISIFKTDDSSLNLIVTNNVVTGNQELSFHLTSTGTGNANVFMAGNGFNSDEGEDALPPITSNNLDMFVTNSATSTTCLAMSNNFFASGALVANAGVAADFTLELDGLTNGVGQPAVIGPITPAVFGTVCSPAIAAEEAFFLGVGFPP